MFDKWSSYIKGEVQASVEDHVLLEKLHTATCDKFKEMTSTVSEKLCSKSKCIRRVHVLSRTFSHASLVIDVVSSCSKRILIPLADLPQLFTFCVHAHMVAGEDSQWQHGSAAHKT